nr:MAG TPA: hypothetical protein [Caudoviricetes sp.]
MKKKKDYLQNIFVIEVLGVSAFLISYISYLIWNAIL